MTSKFKEIINTLIEFVADPQEIITKVSEEVTSQNSQTTMNEEERSEEENIENVLEKETGEPTLEETTIPDSVNITPLKIFAAIFNGVGVGVLLGMLLGLAVSPVVSGFIGALSSILGLLLGLSEKLLSPVKSIRIGAFGLSCVGGILFGIFIRTNNFLSPELTKLKSEYLALGFSEKEALSFIAYQEFGLVDDEWVNTKPSEIESNINADMVSEEEVIDDIEIATSDEQKLDKDGNAEVLDKEKSIVKKKKIPSKTLAVNTSNSQNTGRTLVNPESSVVQNRRASVLFSSEVEADGCYILDMTDESLETKDIINNFNTAGTTWGKFAKNIDQELTNDEDKKKALLLVKSAFCDFDGDAAITLNNCNDIDKARSTNNIESKLKENGEPWTEIIAKAKKDISQNQYKSFLISITNSICDEKNAQ